MLGYIGGKSRIGKWIKDYIPTDIKTYVEPFGGMFWVYFNMDMSLYPNLNNIVYNDVNELNYNLFKCVSENPSRLHTCMTQYPNQEKGNPNTILSVEYYLVSSKRRYTKQTNGNLQIMR